MQPRAEEWFTLEQSSAKIGFWHRGDSVAFNIGLHPKFILHKRQIYTLFEWLGDIGGLLDALNLIGGFIMTFQMFIMGNPLEKFLVTSLFKI